MSIFLQSRETPTGCSFDIVSGSPQFLARFLTNHGYIPQRPRPPREFARLRNGPTLIIISRYTCLVQGTDHEPGIALLQRFVAPPSSRYEQEELWS